VDHLITLNKLNVRRVSWDRLSKLVRLIMVEVGPLVAAVLVLAVHLSVLSAVASCSEACLTDGNDRKVSLDTHAILVVAAPRTIWKPLQDPYVVSVAGIGRVSRRATLGRSKCRLSPHAPSTPVKAVPLNRTAPRGILLEITPIIKLNRNLPYIHLSILSPTIDCHSKLVCFQKLSAVSKIAIVIRKCYRAVEDCDVICPAAIHLIITNPHRPVSCE